MSADEQSGAGRREVAYRVFAAEYDDADFQYTENEADERAPNYVVMPTGARVNRLFVVGVLTEVERVNEEMLRGRIVDPTGAFVVYAGQYQPDALTALERLDPPAFVAVTGKARTFQPEDADTIYTSVRPESVNEVDTDTRDRWTVGTARHTVERVATFADALDREERGEELTAVLEEEGVDHGLAAGIPLAIDHYGTTPAYLEAVRDRAIEAAEVVAGEREEVAPLDLAPEEGGAAGADLGANAGIAGVDDEEPTSDAGGAATPDASSVDASANAGGPGASDGTDEPETATGSPDAPGDEAPSESEEPAAATDEMYEFDEEEREEIESEYSTDFSTGADIEEPGESDREAPEPETTDAGADATPDEAPEGSPAPDETSEPETVDEDTAEGTSEVTPEGTGGDTPEEGEEGTPEVTGGEAESADEPAADVDLEEAVVEAMRDLDTGDGADRDAVIERVSEEHGADPADVEDAIQDALMSGTCYEPGDGLLKAI